MVKSTEEMKKVLKVFGKGRKVICLAIASTSGNQISQGCVLSTHTKISLF